MYARIALSLTEQVKKDRFGWTEDAKTTFHELKQAMTTTSVLSMPNFNLPFIVETNAFEFGLGGINARAATIAFFSHTLGMQA